MVVSVDHATDLPFPVIWNTTPSQAVDIGSGSTFSTVTATEIQYSSDGGATWINTGTGNTMYSLSGSVVPEPSITFLLLGGVGAMLLWRRKHC